jgi:hypothetical protein
MEPPDLSIGERSFDARSVVLARRRRERVMLAAAVAC